MNFVDSIKTCFTKYIDFNGRAKRSEYWWFMLFFFITMFVVCLINQEAANFVSLIFILPGLSVGIRRLHDLNKSGWWYLITLIPLVGPIVLIYWFILPGTPGPNQFGS